MNHRATAANKSLVLLFAVCGVAPACSQDQGGPTAENRGLGTDMPSISGSGGMESAGGAPLGSSTGGGGSSSGGMTAAGGSTEESATGGTGPDADGWQLVWSDEFEGSTIDSSKWQHEVNCWGGGNNEQQCYVDDAKNSYTEDGILHLVAIKDSPSGKVGGPGNEQNIVTMPFSSARLNTAGKAAFKYGRFEARIKLPFGQGMWPAFWMLPTNSAYGGWARSGEIDVMEAVNTSPTNNLIYGTLHYGDSWPGNVHTGEAYDPPGYVADNFFTYAVEWEEGEIRWYVDDVHYATQTEWWSAGNAFPAPFDQEFHLLLNVAVGGAWPGSPDGTSVFPQEMQVDYVRVYECSKDPQTGKGC